MQKKIEEYLASGVPNSSFTICYDIGNAFAGETHLLLRGDGSYTLWSTVSSGRVRLDFSGMLPLDTMRTRFRELVETHFWKGVKDESSTVPDDVKAKITVHDGRESLTLGVWQSKLGDHPAFQAAVRKLVGWIHEFSGGKVLEQG